MNMNKLIGQNLVPDRKNNFGKNTQACLPEIIFSGSVSAPFVRIPFSPNCNVLNTIPVKQPSSIQIGKINIFSLGFTKEEVRDLELSVLEAKMRKKHLNPPQIHIIKDERERLKRQKRKKRHKLKLKTEFIDLEITVDYLLQQKKELVKEKQALQDEINEIRSDLSRGTTQVL